MFLADSRSYVQMSMDNFDNLTASQKFTSCHESTNGCEFHITDTQLMECCNKAEVMLKEVNNVDAPERARGDIFEDFSTTPFNSPITSPESNLRNLERSPLFTLLEKPKGYCSRKFKEKAKSNLEEKFKAAIEDNVSTCSSSLLQCKKDKHFLNVCNQFDDTLIDERIVNLNSKNLYNFISESKLLFIGFFVFCTFFFEKASDRNYDYIEKEDMYNVNETLVSSNQCKTGISKNYHWHEDDNDFFAPINTLEILDQNLKIKSNFPSISKFPGNKQIT
ncbi:uncharacterized protein ACN2A1_001394 isoform 1-T3 [Glossina fuscipes fuscipes]